MESNSKVIYNVVVQYLRTIITVVVTLYTSRLVIDALGEVDYGIYSLLLGVVFMLAFVQSSLSSTTQRFLSFYAGANDTEKQRKVFQNSMFIHIATGAILVLMLLAVIPLLFGGFLNIPADKLQSSVVVYVLMLVIMFLMMISTPYLAVLIARENMMYMSIVLTFVALLKVPVALTLYYVGGDRLIVYVLLLVLVQMIEWLMLVVYCKRKYFETRGLTLKMFDVGLVKEIFAFMGWAVYSTFCVVGRMQGVAVVLNKYFGPVVNTSYSIAWQAGGQLNVLSTAVYNAIKPRIVQREGSGDREGMLRLSETTCKFTFLLLFSFAMPIMMEMPALLGLWLKDVPEGAVMMCRFVVLMHVVDQLTLGLQYGNEAIGKIKMYSLVVNTTKLLTLPAVLVFMMMGYDVEVAMWVLLAFELICASLRLPVMKYQAGLSILGFVRRVLLPEILPCVVGVAVCMVFVDYVDMGWRFMVSVPLAVVVVFGATYLFALNKEEKGIVGDMVNKIARRK